MTWVTGSKCESKIGMSENVIAKLLVPTHTHICHLILSHMTHMNPYLQRAMQHVHMYEALTMVQCSGTPHVRATA